ncbi:MAG TPA: uracil-DNA glycosylase [Nanoarchaeota archaeon]|nr:uracil-DNA glycosylase [Candidatus Woesearchaeota archaeon]HIH15050.1 uracil-DNA glycosylase [Nanoarchaeota archaeon]HIH59488.1 uracil-DNA glycosylase [Nanoarchaeota archaeon]HII14239.1 uracil-DNA glycosylase [Nanoarchaeota archaeon]HIJ04621.1 uracil-DNA glycosylase [Nanoarchaeota archaeon]
MMGTFESLQEEYKSCKKCSKLCESRTQVVFGSGNKNAKIIFIGEAPGANEDHEGIPFCGASGQVLNQLLESVSLSKEDIFITNIILCRPEKNRNPEKEEIENCRTRLDELLKIMQPKVIVTIGNFATERIIKQKGITLIHGKIFSLGEIHVVPVIHPANLLYNGRNPQLLESMKKDFEIIASLLKTTKT